MIRKCRNFSNYQYWVAKFGLTKLLLLAIPIAIVLLFIYLPGRAQIQVQLKTNADSIFQVFWADVDQKYTEKQSDTVFIRKGGLYKYTLFLPDLKVINKLRIDPAKKASEITINSLVIKQIGYESICFSTKDELNRLIPRYDIRNIDYQSDGLRIISSGGDPQLEVPVAPPIAERRLWIIIHYAIDCAKLILLAFLLSASLILGLEIIVKSQEMLIRINEAYYTKKFVTEEHPNSLFNNKRSVLIISSIFFIIILYLLGQKIYVEFNIRNNFGTNSAPYSDALLWLRGALFNYFNKGAVYPLFRPTIGIFFSSIYSVSDQIYHIPLFSILFFFINMLLVFLFFDQHMKIYMTLFLLVILLFFNKLVHELNLGQLMIDFPPFVFTTLSIFLTGWALKNKKIQFHFLYTGLFFLGIASAVRGVQLIGGFIIVITAMIINWKRANKINILLLPPFFLAPLIFDMYLQKISGVENNGMMCFFCFYSDHRHFFTLACGDIYRTMELSHTEVLVNYFKFIFTQEGSWILFDFIEDLLIANLLIFKSKYYLALLILSTVILAFKNFSDDCFIRLRYAFARVLRKEAFSLPIPNPAFNYFIIKVLVHVIIIPVSVWAFPQYAVVIFLSYLVFLIIIALLSGLILTSICLAILYAGNFIIPPRNNHYLKDKHLIKISDEPRLNRSLYYAKDSANNYLVVSFPAPQAGRKYKKTFDQMLSYYFFYTLMDHEEIGAVGSYTNIACPSEHTILTEEEGGDDSLRNPCVIIRGVR